MLVNILIFAYSLRVASALTTCITEGVFKRLLPDCCHYSNILVMWPPGYVGPRNLPSTGFFPFLQTLMCNTDSNCHNKPRVKDPTASHSSRSRHEMYSHLSLSAIHYRFDIIWPAVQKVPVHVVIYGECTTAFVFFVPLGSCDSIGILLFD